MRVLALFLVVLFLVGGATSEELLLRGENRLEYWRSRGTKEEFFEDKFDVEALYGDFLAGLRYYLYQPSETNDPRRVEGLSRMFIEWRKEPFQVRAGTYYSIFGRGLLLSAYEDDEIKLDRDLKGLKASISYPQFEVTAISGSPRNIFDYCTTNDTTDLIRGADLDFRPISILNIGTGYVRLNRKDPIFPDTSRKTDLYGGRGEIIWNWFNLYGEYGKKKGWDQVLFQEGEGEGYYLSSSISLSGLGLSVEYCDYDSLAYGGFAYRYNNPPCPNRYGRSINDGIDERGHQVSVTFTPWEPLLGGGSYAKMETHEPAHAIEESYGELKIESFETGALQFSLDRLEVTDIEPISGRTESTLETIPLLDGYYHITWRHTIACSYRHKMLSEASMRTDFEEEEWSERRASISYSYVPHLTLTVTAEDTGEELPPEEDTFWLSGSLDLKLGESHDVFLMVGSQKGRELICSGGVCRIEPPFEGWKLLLSSRF